MSERSRLPLQPSFSFSGTSSLESGSRTFKRRLTSDTLFESSDSKSFSSRRDMAPIILPLDPSETDHTSVFLHPPFNNFPNSRKYPQGLTYGVMAENPDWFLDADDFITPTNKNPQAIHYPAQLEPPRGWCPAKKKDLKDRGNEGWPEGEEPRLRCTFCRRTYAGVNAKSMWRRHVYEKHKIAMANRRDNANSERSRRRGSTKAKGGENKENKKQEKQARESGSDTEGYQEDKILSQPEMVPELTPEPLSAHIPEEDNEERLFEESSSVPSLSAPFTPHSRSLSSKTRQSIAAASPYDPLVTPTFRHSTPRLPSDQPWRFPSPSHPLHSTARELSLTSVIHGEASAVGPSNILDVSPIIFGLKTGAIESPTVTVPLRVNRDFSQLTRKTPGLGTPVFRTPGYPKASPRRLFSLPTPLQSRNWRLADSPLAHNLRTPKSSGSSTLSTSTSSSSIESEPPTTPVSQREIGLMEPIRLAGDDPFNDIYNSWIQGGSAKAGSRVAFSPPDSSPEDSPVVRTGPRPTADSSVGMEGIEGPGGFKDLALIADVNSSPTFSISNERNADHEWDEIAPPAKRRRIEAYS